MSVSGSVVCMVTSLQVAQRFRKHLMRNHTKGEREMKRMLSTLHYRFKQQVIVPSPTSFYIIDFLLDYNIAVEVDGDHHQFDPRQREWDMIRTKYLKSIGITTIRVNNRALTNSEYEATRRWLDRSIKRLRFKQSKLK